MTPKDKPDQNYAPATLDDIANSVRYVQRKVSDLDARMDDHYHLLREILESVSHENGGSLYDMYDSDPGCL